MKPNPVADTPEEGVIHCLLGVEMEAGQLCNEFVIIEGHEGENEDAIGKAK